MRILLVEDDEVLGHGLKNELAKQNYTVDWVKNGLAAWSSLKSELFDLVILDLSLPKLVGEEVLRNMRTFTNKNYLTPTIILTSQNDVKTTVRSLDVGADDYIAKPFDLESLLARIRVALRKRNSRKDPNLHFEDIVLDPATITVTKAGQPVDLSRREFSLLQILLENVGNVVRREEAIQSMYGWAYDIDSNSLEVHVYNLRKKLQLKNSLITIRGIGYRLRKPEV